MLVSSSTPVQPIREPIATVLKKGTELLIQKKNEIRVYTTLWQAAAAQSGYYRTSEKNAFEKLKITAQNAEREIESLRGIVVPLLIDELGKNSSSGETKQLHGLALVSQVGLNYFGSVAEADPLSCLNETILNASSMSNKLAICSVVLTLAVHISNKITSHTPPSWVNVPMQASLIGCVVFNSINYLNKRYRVNPSMEMVNSQLECFEEGLGLLRNAQKAT